MAKKISINFVCPCTSNNFMASCIPTHYKYIDRKLLIFSCESAVMTNKSVLSTKSTTVYVKYVLLENAVHAHRGRLRMSLVTSGTCLFSVLNQYTREIQVF